MRSRNPGQPRAFTLIELLVVIAMIAILSAMVMPAFSTANDKTNIAQCTARLHQIGLALRAFQDDHGRYPATLQELYDRAYINDPVVLYCTKTGEQFVYVRVPGAARRQTIMACCCDPKTETGSRPHGFGTILVALRANGRVEELPK